MKWSEIVKTTPYQEKTSLKSEPKDTIISQKEYLTHPNILIHLHPQSLEISQAEQFQWNCFLKEYQPVLQLLYKKWILPHCANFKLSISFEMYCKFMYKYAEYKV